MKTGISYILFLFVLMAAMIAAPAVYASTPRTVSAMPMPRLAHAYPNAFADEKSDTMSITIMFRQSELAIDSNYMDNGRILADFVRQFNSLQGTHSPIYIIGYASPEGSWSLNLRLAKSRASVIADYLKSALRVPDSLIVVDGQGVDWPGLYTAVEADTKVPMQQRVLETIKNTPETITDASGRKVDDRLRKLKTIGKGNAWKYMSEVIFPSLRHGDVEVVCMIPLAEEPRPIAEEEKTPILTENREIPEIQTADTSITYTEEKSTTYKWQKLKNNLLFDVALVANLGVEFGFGRKWSIDIPFAYSPYNITDTWRIRVRAVQPELRYWLRDNRRGHYVGIHGQVASFNISLGGDYRWQNPNGVLWGGGIGYGYATRLGRSDRWGIEFGVGAGYARYKYIKYVNGHNGRELSRGRNSYWGITRAVVSISYKL